MGFPNDSGIPSPSQSIPTVLIWCDHEVASMVFYLVGKDERILDSSWNPLMVLMALACHTNVIASLAFQRNLIGWL